VPPRSDTLVSSRDPYWWHVAVVVLLSVVFESRFLYVGLNAMDEGWPLYAARAIHQGWTLYDQAFWVFPPGHLLGAWLGVVLDPPGLTISRAFYAGFNVALVFAFYALGRHFMSATFAFIAALLLAVAAPATHGGQMLFSYRYLVWSTFALICLAQRLRSGDRRWLFAAGVYLGVGVAFRLTPAFAAGCGIGVAAILADRDWRSWLRDWAALALGIVIVVVPVVLYFASTVGLEKFWLEVVIRPVAMTAAQSKPPPSFVPPHSLLDREMLMHWYFAAAFRVIPYFYAGYLVALVGLWGRALVARRPFPHVLLAAVTIWGAVFFARSLGRSDWPHLESAIPPVCLLLAHALQVAWRWDGVEWAQMRVRRRVLEVVCCVGVALSWALLQGSDRLFTTALGGTDWKRPLHPIRSLPRLKAIGHLNAMLIDSRIQLIRKWTTPDQTILDLSASPGLYAIADRDGPGYFDLVMPGTFLSRAEEMEFLAILRRDPPALVIWPERDFDRDPGRGTAVSAPLIHEWVLQNYVESGPNKRWALMLPHAEAREVRAWRAKGENRESGANPGSALRGPAPAGEPAAADPF
jgi:hypothetical protein